MDLRYAWRTHVALWAGLALLFLEAVNAVQRALTWRGDALLAVDAQAIPLFLVGPLLAALVAVDTARDSTAGRKQHVAQTRPVMRPYLYSLGCGVVPCVATLWLSGIAAFVYASIWHFDPATTGPALLQLLVLSAALLLFGALGSLTGRSAPPLVAGLLGVAAGLFAVFSDLPNGGSSFSVMALGGSTVSRVGLTYSVGYQLAQLGLLTALAVLAYWPPPRFSSSGSRPSVAVGASAGLVVAALLVPLPGLPPGRWVAGPPIVMVCSGELPDLYLTPQHDHLRPVVTRLLRELANSAQSTGVDAILPLRVEEITRGDASGVDGVRTWGFTFEEEQLRGQPVDPQLFTINLMIPKHCVEITPAMQTALAQLTSTLLIPTGIPADDILIGEPEDHRVLSTTDALAQRDLLARCG